MGTTPSGENECKKIKRMIHNLPDLNRRSFDIRPVRQEDVLKELHQLSNDCSKGPDQIPVQILKLAVEILVSPLTNILNSAVEKRLIPTAWKTAHICAIPKGIQVTGEQDLRPVSILAALYKIYERLIYQQMMTFIKEEMTLRSNISAYRRG